MNPADKRLSELIDKWLTSLELHLKYSALDKASYWKVQPWVKHDRPSRWIIELGRQKALQLKEQLDGRIAMGDAKFSDAMELMGFLTNLVGSQHISRFIPLAEPQNEVDLATASAAAPAAAPAAMPAVAPAAAPPVAQAAVASPAKVAIGDSTRVAALVTQPRPAVLDTTREMPRAAPRAAVAPPPEATREIPRPAPARSSGRHEARKGSARREGKAAHAARAEARTNDVEREKKVVADAVRLLGWGRQWHELAELISRMADRPPLSEVRRILREQKDTIEKQGASG